MGKFAILKEAAVKEASGMLGSRMLKEALKRQYLK